MSLKDSLPLLPPDPGVTPPEKPTWVAEELRERKNPVSVTMEAPVDLDLRVCPAYSRASSVGQMKAQKFVSLLKEGVKPGEAAHRLHTSLKHIMSEPQAKGMIRQIIEGYTLDASVRRLLARALVNKIALEADAAGDAKTVLDAVKIMGADPEVGLNAAPQTNVNIAVIDPALREVLDRTIPIPALEASPEAPSEDDKA
jgi:hypothetical protein